jgi:hypothetical protein
MMDLIEQHLIQPTKVHTMIQAFMATLSKDTSDPQRQHDHACIFPRGIGIP